jgi:hypothetical protein
VLRWERYGFDKKCDGTRYAELVFLHLVGYAGHVVHPGSETSIHYFSSLGLSSTDLTKNVSGHVTLC